MKREKPRPPSDLQTFHNGVTKTRVILRNIKNSDKNLHVGNQCTPLLHKGNYFSLLIPDRMKPNKKCIVCSTETLIQFSLLKPSVSLGNVFRELLFSKLGQYTENLFPKFNVLFGKMFYLYSHCVKFYCSHKNRAWECDIPSEDLRII